MSTKPAVLITGASSGIGAIYADRFAARGHDLVLVARDGARLDALAARLTSQFGVKAEVLTADLTNPADVARVEARIGDHVGLGVLVNNAGIGASGGFLDQSQATHEQLIALNVVAVTRLAQAAAHRFAAAGEGAIVNVSSVVGLAPELGMTVYGATKAFVLYLSHGLDLELGPKGVYVQAVLPAATRTEIWERSGMDISAIEGVMDAGELVDAALVGFDRRELVTIPPLPDDSQWTALETARKAMLPNFRQTHAARRYRAAA
jgi:short-subunit dehydrogenase